MRPGHTQVFPRSAALLPCCPAALPMALGGEAGPERGTGTRGCDGSCARKSQRAWVCCVRWLPEPAAGHFIKAVMVVLASMVAFYLPWVYFSLSWWGVWHAEEDSTQQLEKAEHICSVLSFPRFPSPPLYWEFSLPIESSSLKRLIPLLSGVCASPGRCTPQSHFPVSAPVKKEHEWHRQAPEVWLGLKVNPGHTSGSRDCCSNCSKPRQVTGHFLKTKLQIFLCAVTYLREIRAFLFFFFFSSSLSYYTT